MSSRHGSPHSHFNSPPREVSMPKCSHCGAEARLYSIAAPLCLACAVNLEPRRIPPGREQLDARKSRSTQPDRFKTAPDDSIGCSVCCRLEADRLEAIKRYVELRTARQCLVRECPGIVPMLDTTLASVELMLNDAWSKLSEHQVSHTLHASA